MSEVINGIHIDISGKELKKIYLDRVSYHTQKVSKYEQLHARAKEVDGELEDEAEQIGKLSSSFNRADSIAVKIKDAKKQITYFSFMASHVKEDAIFRLSESELVRLGISSY